jgi:hypothetical protein
LQNGLKTIPKYSVTWWQVSILKHAILCSQEREKLEIGFFGGQLSEVTNYTCSFEGCAGQEQQHWQSQDSVGGLNVKVPMLLQHAAT